MSKLKIFDGIMKTKKKKEEHVCTPEPKQLTILVLGSNGMLGQDVMRMLRNMSQHKNSIIKTVIGLDVQDGLDVTNEVAVDSFFDASIHYDVCINCVAYTNTSSAEKTKEGAKLDYELNALAPLCIARACRNHGTKLIHISTDYVFSEHSKHYRDGCGNNSTDQFPMYRVIDTPHPVNTYGKDKLIGEQFIQSAFGEYFEGYAILRTSWLYGAANNKSFIHKFLANAVPKLCRGEPLEMTQNEQSIPTSTAFVAACIYSVLKNNDFGVLHAVPCSDAPVTRAEFADAILELVDVKSLSNGKCETAKVTPVERDTYQPAQSAMVTSFPYIRPFHLDVDLDFGFDAEDDALIMDFDWRHVLADFMRKNGKQIVEWAIINAPEE